jgi:hypothetical protein
LAEFGLTILTPPAWDLYNKHHQPLAKRLIVEVLLDADPRLIVGRVRDAQPEALPLLLAVVARASGKVGELCRPELLWSIAQRESAAAVKIVRDASSRMVATALKAMAGLGLGLLSLIVASESRA